MEKNVKYFGTFVERDFRVIKQAFLQTFKDANADITTEQWVVIDLLYQKDGISQNDLAEKSDKDAPTVSRIIDILVKKELVSREAVEGDRRKYHIFLTENGKNLYQLLIPKVEALRATGWNGLNDEDYQHFVRIMNTIYKNLK